MTQGPDHNSYYHELFLRGMPKLCQKMKRPSKTTHDMIGTSAHPDFYTMSLYAPLPNQQTYPGVSTSSVHAVSTSPTNNYSGSDASDRGISVTTYPATSSDSDLNGTSSDSDRNGTDSDRNAIDSDRNGSSRDDSGCSDEGERTSGGSSDGRDDSNGSDRISAYNEDISGSDPSACGSDIDRNSGLEGFGSSSPTNSNERRNRRHPRREIIDRADSSFRGSDSSERSSFRDLSFLLSNGNRQSDLPSIIGGASQDSTSNPQLPAVVGPPGAAGLGLPATTLSGVGQVRQSESSGIVVPMPLAAEGQPSTNFTAPLTAANLSAVNQLSPAGANLFTNLSGTAGHSLTAPLTATNLGYLSLQNQLIQCQATIAQLLAYQQQMGLPPMPAPGHQPPGTQQHPPNHGQQEGK